MSILFVIIVQHVHMNEMFTCALYIKHNGHNIHMALSQITFTALQNIHECSVLSTCSHVHCNAKHILAKEVHKLISLGGNG